MYINNTALSKYQLLRGILYLKLNLTVGKTLDVIHAL